MSFMYVCSQWRCTSKILRLIKGTMFVNRCTKSFSLKCVCFRENWYTECNVYNLSMTISLLCSFFNHDSDILYWIIIFVLIGVTLFTHMKIFVTERNIPNIDTALLIYFIMKWNVYLFHIHVGSIWYLWLILILYWNQSFFPEVQE